MKPKQDFIPEAIVISGLLGDEIAHRAGAYSGLWLRLSLPVRIGLMARRSGRRNAVMMVGDQPACYQTSNLGRQLMVTRAKLADYSPSTAALPVVFRL